MSWWGGVSFVGMFVGLKDDVCINNRKSIIRGKRESESVLVVI